ncbi:MAG: DegT/DnrJ/EryC1/StrS family aminotransferase [Thermodesulfobacteriota bacterium]
MLRIPERLAVVVPVYGNEASLEELHARIDAATRGLGVELTIQFVNDRSPDGSQTVLESIAARDPRVRVLLLSRNHGSFVAIAAGLAQVEDHDAAVILSADLQDPPELIGDMVARWREGKPVVLCSRRNRDDPFLSRMFARAFWWLFRHSALPDVPAGGFDFCLIDRRVVRVILESSEKKTSLVGLILWAGFERAVIPYDRAKRKHGKSMWSLGRKLSYAFHSLVAFSSLPMKAFAVTGLCVATLSFLMIAYVLLANLSGAITVPGWSTLMLFQMVTLAVMLLGFGVIGGYLWINLEQTRRRPLFIVDKRSGADPRKGGARDPAGRVDFFDLQRVSAPARIGLREASHRVLHGDRIILGPEVTRFESRLADCIGIAHAVGVGNGTDSITMALWALGLAPGDLVAVPALTAPPTAVAVIRAGMKPLFVDVDPVTLLMTPDAVALAAERGARAAVPVHLYGNVCDMPAIMDVAGKNGMAVVEDCAQSFGSTLGGRSCGTFGHAASFSFYPTKNLGAYGDAGAVTTSDPEVARKLRSMRFYGQDASGLCVLPGMNSRLDEIQAAFLSARLQVQSGQDQERLAIARGYAHLPGALRPVPVLDGSVPHLFVVRPGDRQRFRHFLDSKGIGTGVHYPVPLHRHPYLAAQGEALDCPVAEDAAASVTSLPCYPGLPEAHRRAVEEACLEYARGGDDAVSRGKP